MLSFNGGKDCTALLHILFAVLNKSTLAPSSPSLSRDDSDENEPSASDPVTFSHPRLLYVRARTPFPETEVFVQSVLRYYRYPSAAVKRRFLSCDWFGDFSALSVPLSNDGPNATETSFLLIYEGPIKAGLARLKTDAPDVEAIFMGTRSSDPWAASTTVMMPTDPDWPPYMRIHPILDWTYTDVWRFIRELSLPYCCLYDCGYTSLGSIEDTHPNPDLRIISPTGLTAYRPAYMLQNPLSERSGRLSSTRKSQSD
uniref:FAD synthase n=1 Tax=Schistocephalus solidus TaxID=70667 RepID=A0A0V0J1Y6_SCHSO